MVGWLLASSTANLASATPSTNRWPPSVRIVAMRPASAQRRTVSTLTPRSSAAWPILYVGMGATLAQKRPSSQPGLAIAVSLTGQLLVRHHGDRVGHVADEERGRVDDPDIALGVDDIQVVGLRRLKGFAPFQPRDLQGRVRSEQPVPARLPLGSQV